MFTLALYLIYLQVNIPLRNLQSHPISRCPYNALEVQINLFNNFIFSRRFSLK